jgi:hypothetical protein
MRNTLSIFALSRLTDPLTTAYVHVYILHMPKKANRTSRVIILVTRADHVRWTQEARSRGISVAQLVRQAVEAHLKQPQEQQ